jgi:hypothetical protein
MSPLAAMDDGVNGRIAHAIFDCELLQADLIRDVAFPDLADLLFRELAVAFLDTFLMRDEWRCVPIVIGVRKPFEVFASIIGLVEIFMIDRMFWSRRSAKEGECYKAVNKRGISLLVLAQDNDSISAKVSASKAFAAFLARAPIAATHAAKVRNLVKALIPNNWFPDLVHSGITVKD